MSAPAEYEQGSGAWLHELRNAVNSACLALDVARRSLEAQELERAHEFLLHAESSCSRTRSLLTYRPAASQGDDAALEQDER